MNTSTNIYNSKGIMAEKAMSIKLICTVRCPEIVFVEVALSVYIYINST